MATTFDPTQHPRVTSGQFADKAQSAPDITLAVVTDIIGARVRRALDKATTISGKPLSADRRALVLLYISEPSEGVWDGIYSTALNRTTSIWSATLQHTDFDVRSLPAETPLPEGVAMIPSAARRRWPAIPTPEQVAEAIIRATDTDDTPPEPDPDWDMYGDFKFDA